MKDSWEVHLLGDKLSVSSGSGLSESKFKPGSIKVYGGNGVVGYHNEFTNHKKEMIIGRVGAHCGNIYLTEEKSWITDNALIISFKDNNAEHTFWYYLLSYLKLREFAFQSAQPVITGGILNRIEVNLPPLPQQRKIAQILSTVDEVLEKTEAAIAKYQQLEQGLMHDVFTRGIDVHTGQLRPKQTEAPELYKQSALGWIPKEWEVEELGNICKVNGRVGWKGYTVADLRNEGPLTIGAAQIDKFNKLDFSKPVHLCYEKYYESPEIMVKKNDILIVQRGTIGKYVLIDREIGEATINPSMVLLNNIQISSQFVYYSFGNHTFSNQILNSTSQTGVPMISQAQISSFQICVPNNEKEVRVITQKLQSIDQKIHAEQQALAKYQQLKAGLLQDLLTGRVEVRV